MLLRVLEAFGGIGACSKALERIGVDYEIVDYIEIDKYAVKSFNAIHGTDFAPQDICDWHKKIDVDLIMHGSPCQDFSVAGKNAGGDAGSGTRSSLMYETLRIVEELKPKYVIWENVKNLLSKKHFHNFEMYQNVMKDLGYVNAYQVMNAKDYGVPQNRERVFTVSIRKDVAPPWQFEFPAKQPLEKRLLDVLESDVDEKYYLSNEQVAGLKFTNPDVSYCIDANYAKGTNLRQYLDKKRRQIVKVGDLDIKGNDQIKRVYSADGLSLTLSTMQGGNRQPKILDDTYKNRPVRVYDNYSPALRSERSGLKVADKTTVGGCIMIKNNTEKGYLKAYPGDGIYTNLSNKRGTVQSQSVPALVSNNDKGVVMPGLRIRKLTPLETWRLMGFDDSDFKKAKDAGVSDSQLYKQAGNSIVVNVLEAILKELLL